MKRSGKSTRAMMDDLGEAMTRQIDLAGEMADSIADFTNDVITGVLERLPQSKGCCDIPEPCWMPQDLGEIHCDLCPGGRGSLRIVVTNTDFRPRGFQVASAGADAARISISPGTFNLGPKERRTVDVTFDAKVDDGVHCAEFDALVWVIGCRAHFLRWTVEVGKRDGGCCHEIAVNDQPDYVHHWYDHFYCMRDCFGRVIQPDPKDRPTPEPVG